MSIKNQSYESSQKIISRKLDLEIKAFDRKTVQKDQSVRLEVTFTKEQMEAFNKVKSLMSHVNPSATVAEVFEHLAKEYLKRKDPSRKNEAMKGPDQRGAARLIEPTASTDETKMTKNCGSNTKQRNAESAMKPVNKRKSLSVNIKRIVWTRDRGQCQHLNVTTGKRCGSSHLLEIDHVKRLRHGGDDHPQNLRLLCKAHNLWRG